VSCIFSPRRRQTPLSHTLTRQRAAHSRSPANLAALLANGAEFLDQGLLAPIVCEDDHWGAVGNPQTPIPASLTIVTFRTSCKVHRGCQWPQSIPTTFRLLPNNRRTTDCRRAPCSATAILLRLCHLCCWARPAQATLRRRAQCLRSASVIHTTARDPCCVSLEASAI